MADINDAALVTHQRQDNTHSKKFQNMHNNWSKTLKKKIPSFLSGDDEPKVQNKNSVCGLSFLKLALSLSTGQSPNTVIYKQHTYPSALQMQENSGNTYAVTETPFLFDFFLENLSWHFPCQQVVLKASFSPGLRNKIIYIIKDIFL